MQKFALDHETIRRLAALGGLSLTPEQASVHASALEELLTVDATIVALKLGPLPAVGHPWGTWRDESDRRG